MRAQYRYPIAAGFVSSPERQRLKSPCNLLLSRVTRTPKWNDKKCREAQKSEFRQTHGIQKTYRSSFKRTAQDCAIAQITTVSPEGARCLRRLTSIAFKNRVPVIDALASGATGVCTMVASVWRDRICISFERTCRNRSRSITSRRLISSIHSMP